MFNDSKYTKWYFNIIRAAQSEQRAKGSGVYYEKHHIIPKSCGGSDDLLNLVLLTAREHFVAHMLLTKMFDCPLKHKMQFAMRSMARSSKHRNAANQLTSWEYEFVRRQHVQALTIQNTGRVHSKETRQKMSASQKGRPLADEHKAKLSEAAKKRAPISKETRERMSASMKGKLKGPFSEEHKAKLRASRKAYFERKRQAAA